jgi:hypothetical protein
MKKVLLLAVVALFVMMPLASFAMTTISDSDLNAITAQEGVSIYLDNVTLTGMTMTASWGQSTVSGLSPVGGAIKNFGFDQGGFFGAVVSVGEIGVSGLLTIDVGTNNAATLSDGTFYKNTYGGTTSGTAGLPGGIKLGLNNIALSVGALQMIIKVGQEKTLSTSTTVNLIMSSTSATTTAFTVPTYMTMGTAYVSGLNTTVNGNIYISTH